MAIFTKLLVAFMRNKCHLKKYGVGIGMDAAKTGGKPRMAGEGWAEVEVGHIHVRDGCNMPSVYEKTVGLGGADLGWAG